jgi:predicted RNA-binding Zn-ribbon protein involved in translation (DUF1610 family)
MEITAPYLAGLVQMSPVKPPATRRYRRRVREAGDSYVPDPAAPAEEVADSGVAVTEDDRPPICPACGVTMGLVVDEETGETRYVCLECGFDENDPE